jgi:hypothetical protein
MQSEKHFCIRRQSKVISHINHLSYILSKSLIMTWRSSGKLSKHSTNHFYIEFLFVHNYLLELLNNKIFKIITFLCIILFIHKMNC